MANLRVDKITSTETFETTGSVQFDGSGDYLSIPSSTDFDFSSDYTIEGFFCASALTSRHIILDTRPSGASTPGYTLFIDGNNSNILSFDVASSQYLDSSSTIEKNSWYHFAICRNGNTARLFLNGVLETTVNSSQTLDASDLIIGFKSYTSSSLVEFQGFISNLRVIKGTALYTSNFKPPMRELEVTPETVLLACQHKTDASHEKTGKTITVNGNAVANELTPGLLTDVVKSGGNSAITGSVEFDGTGDYLTIPNTEDLRLADSDFTIELWATISKVDSNYSPFALFENSSALRSYQLEVRTNGAVRFEWWYNGSGSYDITTGTGAVIVNEWYHYAVSRNGATIKLFINGIEVGSADAGVNAFFNNTVTPFIIGGMFQSGVHQQKWQGNISNFRIVKGTALYTADFIPPTRELKKVPGTVLLCCQDSNNPLTEATGKTITPYGSLGDGSLGSELVTNNDVWTLAKSGSGATDWTVSNNGRSLAGTTVTSGYIRATYTVPKGDYLVSFRWTGGAFAAQSSAGYLIATDGTSTEFGTSDDGAYSVYMSDTTYVRFTGTSWNTAYTVDDISIKRIYKNNGGSNFTPQVGDDRKVTFEGVTKINSDAYFYLPTGDTASREATGTYNAGTRGVALGGDGSNDITIDYITIASTGDAIDFGDLTISDSLNGDAVADHTRGVCLGGRSNVPTPNSRTNAIQFVTISSTGNSQDFGDLVGMNYGMAGFSDSTRGISAGGGLAPNSTANIDYITISSKGDGQDFGDCINTITYSAGFSSPTRGIKAGGGTVPGSGTETNHIEYVTIQTTGNGQDFGDLIRPAYRLGGCSNAVRGVILEGETPAGDGLKAMSFVTIASMGNAQEFGDATTAGQHSNGTSSSTRGVFMGRQGASPYAALSFIDFVHIMTTANAQDFGDLTIARQGVNACSNGHGGLG